MKPILPVLILTLLLGACGRQGQPTPEQVELQKHWDEMMVVHDEVMPKMSDIRRLKIKLREEGNQIDLITRLTEAETGMWDWMHDLQPIEEVQQMQAPAAMEYIKQEMVKIQAVSRLMKESIREAEATISQNEEQ